MTTRWIKVLVSLGVWLADALWAAGLKIAGRKPAPRCVVLNYHGVRREFRNRFAQQMDDVSRWTKTLAADHREPLADGHRYVIVTFDDALVSVAENAVPEMEKRGIASTIFAPTDYLGSRCTWMRVEQFEPSERDRQQLLHDRVMTEEQLKNIQSHLTRIGAHGVRHVHLTALEETEARQELVQSKLRLEKLLGRPVTVFSFPRGEFTAPILQWAREAGYHRVFTTEPRLALSDPEEFVSGRFVVEPSDWRIEFRLKLLGAYRWLPAAFAMKAWLRRILGRPWTHDRAGDAAE